MKNLLVSVLLMTLPAVAQNTKIVDPANTAGWSGATPDAWIASAIASLPGCTDVDGNRYSNCGVVNLAPGSYLLANTVRVTSPNVSIVGPSVHATVITTPAGSCGFIWEPAAGYGSHNKAGHWGGFTLVGNSAPSSCGIEYKNIVGISLQDILFENYTGAGAYALWGNGTAGAMGFSERDHFTDLWCHNNTVCWELTNNRRSGTTFGYGVFDLSCNTFAEGQICINAVGGGPSGILRLDNSDLKVICNLAPGPQSTTCISLNNYAVFNTMFNIHAEGGRNCTALWMDANSSFNGMGTLSVEKCANIGFTRLPIYWDAFNGRFISGWPTQLNVVNISSLRFPEGNAQNGFPGYEFCGGNATTHTLKCSYNNGPSYNIPQSLNGTLGAIQSRRGVAGCTTSGSVGGSCSRPIRVMWPTAFTNTNYSAGCNPSGPPSNLPSAPYVVSKSTDSIIVNYSAMSDSAASWTTIDCWAEAD